MPKRKAIARAVRDQLLVEAMHRCCLCPEHHDVTDLHHIVPISQGGPDDADNLMVVCPTCHAKIHRLRSRYTPAQLRMYKERWTGLCALGLPLDARLLDYAADHTRPPGDSPTLPAAPGAGGAPLNPFCDRGRINDSARFFGRKRIRREMEQMLAAGNSISLVGEPEVGKSSLLFLLEHTQARWLTDGTTLYLDLQGVLDEDDLCSEILDGLGCEGNGFRSLRRALRRERVVLLLDEAEMLAGDAFSARLQDRLRALSQEPTLTLAVASHRPLEHVFPRTGPTSPFHNVFTEKRMGPFAPNDARAFVAHRLGPTGVSFAASEVEWLLEESTCHPARLQRLAHRLFEEKK